MLGCLGQKMNTPFWCLFSWLREREVERQIMSKASIFSYPQPRPTTPPQVSEPPVGPSSSCRCRRHRQLIFLSTGSTSTVFQDRGPRTLNLKGKGALWRGTVRGQVNYVKKRMRKKKVKAWPWSPGWVMLEGPCLDPFTEEGCCESWLLRRPYPQPGPFCLWKPLLLGGYPCPEGGPQLINGWPLGGERLALEGKSCSWASQEPGWTSALPHLFRHPPYLTPMSSIPSTE